MTATNLGMRVKRQRGAATLIAAVLLLSVVMIALLLGLLNATTDITDTSLQSDGVEALFIAESGLENAIRRFDTGTACGALALNNVGVGRGTFSVNNGSAAGLPATQCRVQVTGVVNASNTARTIESVITQSAAGGTIVLSNVDFEAGVCPPGPTNWTLTANWTPNVCNAWVTDTSTNGTRVLYSTVPGGGGVSVTAATQPIACTTGAGGNTRFRIDWDYRYSEGGPGRARDKNGGVIVQFIDSVGNAYPSVLQRYRNNTNPPWSSDSVNINIPAGSTLVSFELYLGTWQIPTAELWVDNVTITRVNGPGCQVSGQALTWTPVPRP